MSTMIQRHRAAATRFDAFRELVSNTFVPLQVDPILSAQPFDGRLRSVELGALRVTEVAATPHIVRRTPKLITRSDPECYKVGVQLRGTCLLAQGERETTLRPGDLTIYETSRPYTMMFDGPYRQLVLMLPRNLLRLPDERITEITGRRVPGDRGAGALLSVFLRQLAGQLDTLDLPGNVRLADNILDLLVTVYAEQLDLERPATRPLMLTILSYLERQLADPGLSPDRIAAAHYISTRYLHKLFHEEHTTVVRWLRERRLERCRHDLRDPMQADRPVGLIAAGWGFADPAHFSRVFRAAYGSSPNEYRARYFAKR
ncbi:MAG TPA: helix-turn-helix domain-containing protein [Pseudonocardiaceae bacterium]|nr:helix-turn-helix domain-containing protein [Pseudonocardiaceae bacterium]